MIRKFRENDKENGRNFAKINHFRMSFENFAKEILRKFGNPRCCTVQYSTGQYLYLGCTWYILLLLYPRGAVQYSTVSLPRVYMVLLLLYPGWCSTVQQLTLQYINDKTLSNV